MMGKRNKRNKSLLSNSQSLSNISNKTASPLSIHKFKKLKKKTPKKSIQKFFQSLRNENQAETSMVCSNNTVIELTESDMNENQIITPTKCSIWERSANLIIIDDDDLQIKSWKEPMTPSSDLISSPMHCSTPINNKNIILQAITPDVQPSLVNGLTQNSNTKPQDVTTQINKDSYLTIDLTTETQNTRSNNESNSNTIIDLVNNTDTINDLEHSPSSSMSGDSQVTVIQNRRNKLNGKQMDKFLSGIAKLNSKERGRLLQVIARKIFNDTDSSSHLNIKSYQNREMETAENTFIKEVILGQAPSRNSIGSNIYNPQRDVRNRTGLRMVVIDGSNVAMEHSKGRVFSVEGLKICIEYFVHRGHVVKAFVPHFRCQLGKSTDGKLLDSLERQGLVVYTPSRKVQNKLISSYDDRYIVQCAAEFDGVIVSRDNYRDLLLENPRWRSVIENRLLQFTWVGDLIMFPKDPLGRSGPTLEEFLRHPTSVENP